MTIDNVDNVDNLDLAWWAGTMTIDNVDNLDLAWWAGTMWNTSKWSIGLEQWKMLRSMLILVTGQRLSGSSNSNSSGIASILDDYNPEVIFSRIDLLSRPRYMPASGSWKIKHSRGRLGGCHHRRHLLLHGKQPPSSNDISFFLLLRCWPSSST